MAYFDKADVQNSLVKMIADYTDCIYELEEKDFRDTLFEINGMVTLYTQILDDMKKEDEENAKKREEARKKAEAKTDGSE